MKENRMCVVTTTSITIKSFLLQQLIFLSQNGYDITIVCNYDEELIAFLPKNIKYNPITMKRGVDGLGALNSLDLLYKLFKKERFDIVQYSTPNAALYASIASWLTRTPVRLYCQWGIRYVGFTGWRRRVFKAIEKIVCSLSTYIEPDSYGNLQFSKSEKLYTSNKSNVIWNGSANGVDLNRFDFTSKQKWSDEIRQKYKISNDDLVFGFIGRLNKDKGINELLSAFKYISQHNVNVKLMMIGPEENAGVHQDLFEWSQQSETVIYCGFTNEVEKYYSALDVFILPSYREGFGSVVIEAEAMGIPVIVTDIPGPTDAMLRGETGLVVPKGEVDPLIEAMKTMLNPTLRHEMGEKAIVFVREKFDQRVLWKHILEDRNRLVMKERARKEGVV
ncbi:glycosyltransferase family 4 protein [Halalkalibacter alkaliphilus]|uniref:Glycosyltransferase family 4 protein n=1 Tax=Halalkalibacter alkaliphilus TaxID=2917993 RepID=A0A9X2CMZ6_9BACI|nr:glycosyltransferase family 4 protein [Halalkalibacter alkaliphilus]MCL7746083.1 glycosyltransferase family 4 protein [Halalkalibacter alkaliphilus]